jgi:enolase
MTTSIRLIQGLEMLDSRGNPTVAAEVVLDSGVAAVAMVPSGASTGVHEAIELRDGDPGHYGGKGVLRALANINDTIAPALRGMDAANQDAVDQRLIALDGTANKSRLGANAILAVSCACARAAARERGKALWDHLRGGRTATLPLPMVNILSGGHHAGHNFEFQDFLVIPRGFPSYPAALEAIVAVHRSARAEIEQRGFVLTGVADEGGWGPKLPTNELALDILTAAIARAGLDPGRQMAIALDVAASHFWHDGRYHLSSEGRDLSSDGMIELLAAWTERYPVISIEDGLAEDDWDGWQRLSAALGARVQLVGDDLFVTNLVRLERGIASGAANAVLVKMNQIGTLTETLAVVDRAHRAGYRAVISARSGETEDDFLADLAAASGAGQIKIGSVRTSERLAKYNRLLLLARDLPWAGAGQDTLPISG